jgi:recombination protein RecA
MFGTGINSEGCVVDVATGFDIINKAGAWFSYNGEKIGQGRDNAIAYLKANPSILKEIEAKVKAEMDARNAQLIGVNSADFAGMDDEVDPEAPEEDLE